LSSSDDLLANHPLLAHLVGRQALLTAIALHVLRACVWLADSTHAFVPVSRFARLVVSVHAAAVA
jgi:hypothetical protein